MKFNISIFIFSFLGFSVFMVINLLIYKYFITYPYFEQGLGGTFAIYENFNQAAKNVVSDWGAFSLISFLIALTEPSHDSNGKTTQ